MGLLTIEQVAEELQVSRGVLAQWRYEGVGPTYVKMSPRQVRYDTADVKAWIDAQKRTKTEEAA